MSALWWNSNGLKCKLESVAAFCLGVPVHPSVLCFSETRGFSTLLAPLLSKFGYSLIGSADHDVSSGGVSIFAHRNVRSVLVSVLPKRCVCVDVASNGTGGFRLFAVYGGLEEVDNNCISRFVSKYASSRCVIGGDFNHWSIPDNLLDFHDVYLLAGNGPRDTQATAWIKFSFADSETCLRLLHTLTILLTTVAELAITGLFFSP